MKRLPLILNLLLAAVFGVLAVANSAQTMTVAVDRDSVGDSIQVKVYNDDIAPSKPKNLYTTADIRERGWNGCVQVKGDKVVLFEHVPTSHIVRLPVSEGWDYVRMSPADVSARNEGFGGTTTQTDDVKVIANCY